MPTAPLPSGRTGLPLIGETIPYLRDGFAFIEERVREHGNVFRTRLLGRDTVVICGSEATGLFADEARITRVGAALPHVEQASVTGSPPAPTCSGPGAPRT